MIPNPWWTDNNVKRWKKSISNVQGLLTFLLQMMNTSVLKTCSLEARAGNNFFDVLWNQMDSVFLHSIPWSVLVGFSMKNWCFRKIYFGFSYPPSHTPRYPRNLKSRAFFYDTIIAVNWKYNLLEEKRPKWKFFSSPA